MTLNRKAIKKTGGKKSDDYGKCPLMTTPLKRKYLFDKNYVLKQAKVQFTTNSTSSMKSLRASLLPAPTSNNNYVRHQVNSHGNATSYQFMMIMTSTDKERLVVANVQHKNSVDEALYGSLHGPDGEDLGGRIQLSDEGKQTDKFPQSHKTSKSSRKRVFTLIILTMVVITVTTLLACMVVMKPTKSAAVPMQHPDRESLGTTYCDSAHCQEIASSIFDKMNPSADPCEDFYEYSCGGWIQSHQIPPKLPTTDTFFELRETLASQLKVLIEKPVNLEGDLRVTKEIKQHYIACTDEDTIERKDAMPLIHLLEFLGGWPVLGSSPGGRWEESNFDLTNLLSTINKVMDEGSIVATFVSRDDKNPSRNILWIDQGKLGLPNRDFYSDEFLNEKYLQAYFAFMKEVVTKLTANSEDLDRQLQDIINFEKRMAADMKSQTERRVSGSMYNRMTIEELQQLAPQVDWLTYFNTLGGSWTSIDLSEEVVLTSPPYITETFRRIDETSPRTVVNYLLWRVVAKVINHLSSRFRKASVKFGLIFVKPEDEDYDSVGMETDETLASWKTCVKLINKEMTFATGRMYIDAYYDETNQEPVTNMVADIEASFTNMLENSRWMDENTQKAAMNKAKAIGSNIGFPYWTMDDKMLEEYYSGLHFSSDHFNNYINYLSWNFKRSFSKLREKPLNEWIHGPAAVNAYYSFVNTLTVPAGILQPPFYHKDSPQYLNFGGIGMVIGHELTHGFDDKGRVYDKNGVLKESWWSKESETEFHRKEQCIVDQYSEYKMNECNMTLNGQVTVGENIADNGGIKETYKAYQVWREKTSITEPLLKLPGLNLSQEQLLFTNFAQIWCSKFTVDGARNKILTGRHSPGYYRVIGPLSNLPEFSDVFNCASGTTMNPPSKCQVW
ncbi:endothelin-converting enzyme homolog [Glandiceps talaboti]